MTAPTPPPIAYASPSADPVPRALRRTVAAASIFYGTSITLAHLYFFALSRHWIFIAADWGRFTPFQNVLQWAAIAASAALAFAGILLARSLPAGIPALRLAAALSIAATVALTLDTALREPGAARFHAVNLLFTLANSTLPALLLTLTLGPLGRTLRRP